MDQNQCLFDKKEFLDLIEQTFVKVLGKYISPELRAYISLEAISEKKKQTKEKLLNTEQICKLLQVTRQTLNNWEKDEYLGKHIRPFVHSFRHKKYYDATGFMLILFRYQENFGNDRRNKEIISGDKSGGDMVKYSFSEINNKVILKKELNNEEILFYLDECKVRGLKDVFLD